MKLEDIEFIKSVLLEAKSMVEGNDLKFTYNERLDIALKYCDEHSKDFANVIPNGNKFKSGE